MDESLPLRKRPFIGVIGAGSCTNKIGDLAREVGRIIAEKNAIIVCGGLGGVMEEASRGAKEAGGMTIGILPGNSKHSANRYIDISIATGIGEARNLVIIKTADAVIALPGEYGTLSEMAFSLQVSKPLISLANWEISDDVRKADNPRNAVEMAINLAEKKD